MELFFFLFSDIRGKYFPSNSTLNSSQVISSGCLSSKVELMTKSHYILSFSWKAPMIIQIRCSIGHAILSNIPIVYEIHRKVSSTFESPKNGHPSFFTKYLLPKFEVPHICWSIWSFPKLQLRRMRYYACQGTANSNGFHYHLVFTHYYVCSSRPEEDQLEELL